MCWNYTTGTNWCGFDMDVDLWFRTTAPLPGMAPWEQIHLSLSNSSVSPGLRDLSLNSLLKWIGFICSTKSRLSVVTLSSLCMHGWKQSTKHSGKTQTHTHKCRHALVCICVWSQCTSNVPVEQCLCHCILGAVTHLSHIHTHRESCITLHFILSSNSLSKQPANWS